jgi:putative hydrolase of the HAD superfamily
MFELLKKLKKNYMLAVLSSTGKEWLAYKIKTYTLDSYFSHYITSCDTHLKKTDTKIYTHALDTLHIKPEESLFIDDKQKILDVAQSVGMHTLLFTDTNQLSVDLHTLNIQI